MINCCRIFLTVSQNPTLCMQSYCNHSAMMKMVHEFEAKGCRGRLTVCGWLPEMSMFQLLCWTGSSPLCVDVSVKNTCKLCFWFRKRYWGKAGAGVPESSLFSYFGFHQKEALLQMLEGVIKFWSHAFHF